MTYLTGLLAVLSLWLGPMFPWSPSIPQGLIQPTTTSSTSSTTTSVVEVTTTTTIRSYPSTSTPTTRTTLAAAPANDIWWELALCEDNGRNRDFGEYSGYFHFLPSTYHAYGGTGQPSDDDYAEQLKVAKRLQAAEGWWPWPGCKAKLGL